MEIIDVDYTWSRPLTPRSATTRLILHHAAGSNMTAQDIHRMHLRNGWKGIAYNYYVRKDGKIYRGRPEWMEGGHTTGYNHCSIGICFEGNFDTEYMGNAQLAAGVELVADIKSRCPGIEVIGHRDVNATACPGRNFPMQIIKSAELPAEEDKDMVRYHEIIDAPEWAQPTLFKLVSQGALKGNDNGLDLSDDMIRLLVIMDRMGVFS